MKQPKHHQEILLEIARKNRVKYCDLVAKYIDLIDIGLNKDAAVEEIINYYDEQNKENSK